MNYTNTLENLFFIHQKFDLLLSISSHVGTREERNMYNCTIHIHLYIFKDFFFILNQYEKYSSNLLHI